MKQNIRLGLLNKGKPARISGGFGSLKKKEKAAKIPRLVKVK